VTSEWDIERLDLPAYLERVGHDGDTAPTVATLTALHRAHLAAIPFENLDIILGRGIAVDLESVQRKLVHGRRGGYCYETGCSSRRFWSASASGSTGSSRGSAPTATRSAAGPT
jgi:hypothetical protein